MASLCAKTLNGLGNTVGVLALPPALMRITRVLSTCARRIEELLEKGVRADKIYVPSALVYCSAIHRDRARRKNDA